MAFKIEIDDFAEILSYGNESISSPEKDRAFSFSKGKISYDEQIIREDLSILQGRYLMNDDLQLTGKGSAPILEMHFNLSPKSILYKNKIIKSDTVEPMSGNIIYINENDDDAKIGLQKDVIYTTFDVHLPVSLLLQYEGYSPKLDNFLNTINNNTSIGLSNNEIKVNSKMYCVIQDIQNCQYTGLTQKIYLESKIYELIALSYDSLNTEYRNLKLTSFDKEKIYLAAQIIRENINKPFTITDLSSKVGINQTKLKQGFKSVFGNTVFGYMQDIRMKKAQQYLQDTDLSVEEIGLFSGYQNVSNFSASFKKTFGYSPTSLRKGCIK